MKKNRLVLLHRTYNIVKPVAIAFPPDEIVFVNEKRDGGTWLRLKSTTGWIPILESVEEVVRQTKGCACNE